jgi:Spy/CpxP family protein refolding chaperone
MSFTKKSLAAFLAATTVAVGAAQAAPGDFHGRGGHHGGPMMPLRGLDLTEAQRDQIFKIFHDQAPAAREQMKQVREARLALAKAAGGDRYDEAGVRAAAEAQGKAVTQLAVMRAQTIQRVNAVLTPEQRAKVKERAERRGRHQEAR